MTKQTVDIIEELVASLNAIFVVKAITVDGSNWKIESHCTWWLSTGCKIEINGVTYRVISFVLNDYIIVSGASIPNPINSLFPVPNPVYLHGTLKDARDEVTAQEDKELVYPLVYLKEVIRDQKNTDDESMIEREVDLRLFFINSADSTNWITDNHYTEVINPIQSMVDLFMFRIDRSALWMDELDYSLLPLIDISVDGEQEKSLFDTNVSGIENKLFAQIRHDLSCNSKCNCISNY
jgi:hypothetical protein